MRPIKCALLCTPVIVEAETTTTIRPQKKATSSKATFRFALFIRAGPVGEAIPRTPRKRLSDAPQNRVPLQKLRPNWMPAAALPRPRPKMTGSMDQATLPSLIFLLLTAARSFTRTSTIAPSFSIS